MDASDPASPPPAPAAGGSPSAEGAATPGPRAERGAAEPATDEAAPTGEARSRPSGLRRAGLFLLAFGSGFAVLTIEIAGARLIAPVFGLSAVPWTAVIGVILAALAVGSHLGGRLADGGRVPLAAVLVVAGVAAALPIVGSGVPWVARGAFGFIGGAVASALVLFAPPVLCLGAVVPYLVQADTESLRSVGRRAGDMSAAATAGSIAGSFATGFVLLPLFPLPLLLGLTAGALLGLAALSAWVMGARVPVAALVVALIGLETLALAASARPPGTLARTQTLYASVSVTERTRADCRVVREMWQNGGYSSAEYMDTGFPAHRYVDVSGWILEPVVDRVESLLVLGGAALSLPVTFKKWRPRMAVDVVEIDPVVTELAREFFAYGEDPDAITVTDDDARLFLRGEGRSYDVIYLDVFDHFLTVPWTLVTVEAFREMEGRLAPGGLFMANVLAPLEGPGFAFLGRLEATLLEVFGAVRFHPTEGTDDPGAIQNVIVVAARDAGALEGIDWPAWDVEPLGPPLTDAWAPVEYLQAKMILEGIRWN